MESEPAGVPGLAANECALQGVGFDCSALRSTEEDEPARASASGKRTSEQSLGIVSSVLRTWKVNPPGRAPARTRLGEQSLGIKASAFRSRKMKPSESGHRFEPGRARERWGSCPPSSAGHDSAGRRGLPDKQV